MPMNSTKLIYYSVYTHTHAHITPRDSQMVVTMETSCDVHSAHVHSTFTLIKLSTLWSHRVMMRFSV